MHIYLPLHLHRSGSATCAGSVGKISGSAALIFPQLDQKGERQKTEKKQEQLSCLWWAKQPQEQLHSGLQKQQGQQLEEQQGQQLKEQLHSGLQEQQLEKQLHAGQVHF